MSLTLAGGGDPIRCRGTTQTSEPRTERTRAVSGWGTNRGLARLLREYASCAARTARDRLRGRVSLRDFIPQLRPALWGAQSASFAIFSQEKFTPSDIQSAYETRWFLNIVRSSVRNPLSGQRLWRPNDIQRGLGVLNIVPRTVLSGAFPGFHQMHIWNNVPDKIRSGTCPLWFAARSILLRAPS